MTIDRITEYSAGYVLIIQRCDNDLYEWQVSQNDGVWLREIEASRYALSLNSTIEEGRTALRTHVGYDAFLAKWQKRAEA